MDSNSNHEKELVEAMFKTAFSVGQKESNASAMVAAAQGLAKLYAVDQDKKTKPWEQIQT